MTTSASAVTIVGAGAAGLSAAEALRARAFEGRLTAVCDEPGAPIDRPPISKQVLAGTWTLERTSLLAPERLAALDADWRLGVAATAIDVEGPWIELATRASVHRDAALLTSGLRPRLVEGCVGSNVEGTIDGYSFAQAFSMKGRGALTWNAPCTMTRLRRELTVPDGAALSASAGLASKSALLTPEI